MRRERTPLVGLDRFGTLLFFLLAAFLVSAWGDSGWPKVVGSAANVAALLVGFRATGLWSNRGRLAVLVAVGVVGATLVGSFPQTSPLSAIGALGQAIVLGAVLIAVVGRVLGHERVGLPTLAGAIAAFFLIGLVFAWIYLAAYGFRNEPILDPEATGLPAYYSFVVLTTLGFGDISPIDDLVRHLTVVEAMTGQVFLATLVARLVTMYGVSAREQR